MPVLMVLSSDRPESQSAGLNISIFKPFLFHPDSLHQRKKYPSDKFSCFVSLFISSFPPSFDLSFRVLFKDEETQKEDTPSKDTPSEDTPSVTRSEDVRD